MQGADAELKVLNKNWQRIANAVTRVVKLPTSWDRVVIRFRYHDLAYGLDVWACSGIAYRDMLSELDSATSSKLTQTIFDIVDGDETTEWTIFTLIMRKDGVISWEVDKPDLSKGWNSYYRSWKDKYLLGEE